MKIFVAALLLTAAAAAQNTNIVMHSADPLNTPPPPTVTVSPGAGSNSSASASSAGAAVTGSGTSFAEISDEKKAKKAVVVPNSLQSSDRDSEPGLNAGIDKIHADAANTTPQPAGLHFNDLADGIDPVSATVRRFQMFCNNHTMAQDETEVRQWAKANQNIVASNPIEMQRKQQYPQVRDQLIGLKFPKDWFDGGT